LAIVVGGRPDGIRFEPQVTPGLLLDMAVG